MYTHFHVYLPGLEATATSNPIVTTATVNCRRIRFLAWISTSGNDLPAGQRTLFAQQENRLPRFSSPGGCFRVSLRQIGVEFCRI